MRKISLILILILAFLLRFWKLGEYPALNADEAAIGYNVYSLIQTGHDEHGNSWPIHFQSFNDYKPGLYFYLVFPFVKFLGLNEWVVRVPNAILGVLSVLLVYFLVNELFPKKQIGRWKLEIGLFASLMLAISPWHIHFSRGGWEVNTSTFFIILGLYLFLKGLKNLPILMLSFLSLTSSLYTYHAARVIVPLLGVGILVIYKDIISKNVKNFLLAGLFGLVSILPLIKDFTNSNVTSRASGVGLFADTGYLSRINEQRGEHFEYTSFWAKILHNKPVNYGLAFLGNWASHYNGEFLFLSGDVIQRSKVPETGQMYILDFLFLVAGIMTIFYSWEKLSNKERQGLKIVFWWLIVGPVASALTFQSPNALRAQNMVIPLIMIVSYGFASILKWVMSLKIFKAFLFAFNFAILTLIVWQFARYQHMYWIHMAKEYPFSSQYGVKELVSFIKEKQTGYKKIIISDRYDQPYILFLFYLKYPPFEFQKNHQLTARDKFGFSTVRSFDKFEFREVKWDTDQPANSNSLIVGTDDEIPDEANIIKEIYGSNGFKYFQVVAN